MAYEIYPNSSPEFKMIQKEDGSTQMMVRYINKPIGYTGQWMPIVMEKENGSNNNTCS